MKPKVIKGDIIDLFDKGFFDIIAHGCNCRKIMGAGLAAQIKDRIPEAYDADLDFHEFEDIITPAQALGKISTATIKKPNKNEQYVFNLYTQIDPGPNFDENAFKECLARMGKSVDILGLDIDRTKIGFPYIGCGIGGYSDKHKIEALVEKWFSGYNYYFVEYEPK
jgi:O-acetyl-ADP-ribose deacetylase (regulator of RNase III)